MKSALASSLRSVGEQLEHSFTAERFSQKRGLLQALDARVKLVTILLIILVVAWVHQPLMLLGLYLLALGAALASAIPAGYFISRVWLPLPLVAALIAVPALFLTPGPALLVLPLSLVVTRSGALSAAMLFLRVGASASFAVLLVLTTSWGNILRALAVLRIPDVIVLILGMTYRYIYVLLERTNNMLLSRVSRTVGRLGPQQERALEGAIAGTLLAGSLEMSSEVYLAMRSRGFTGYAHTLKQGKVTVTDVIWSASVLMLSSLALIVGR